MKSVLVIHYSQSGQLTEIVKNISAPIQNDSTEITHVSIKMKVPFPFPWKKKDFFGIFPDTYKQIPHEVEPLPEDILNKTYDLIILGYSIWYLTPALPTSSFLNTKQAENLFRNKPVITVIGCRNMWIMAQEKMKKRLKALNAHLVGNIVLADRHINHISVITIAQWMFSGKKERYLGIFPKPGVSQKDIDESVKFGPIIAHHLKINDYQSLQNELLKANAVKIKPFLITVDKRANVIFSKWADFIYSKGDKSSPKRQFWVKFFNYYLLFAIWFIAPIVFILFLLTYLPLYGKIKRDKVYYASVALKE